MAQYAQRAEWLPTPLAWLALGAALSGVAAQAVVGLQGGYLNYVSGVWLTLAGDVSGHGIFYRDLVSELGYGGTRYFPLFFLTIAGFLKAGMAPASAGVAAGVLSMAILATGAYRVARAAGAPVLTAAVLTAGATAPYFTFQAAFEVRADVLAAGLNLLGISMVLPAWTSLAAGRGWRVWPAAVLFLLAFATKVTAFTIPAALIAAAVATGKARWAVRFALAMAGGAVVFLSLVQLASSGRAFRVWGAVMFAGADSAGTVLSVFSGGYLSGLFSSHLVIATMVLALVALAVGAIFGRRAEPVSTLPLTVPVVIWLSATATLGLTLSSPGTVPANQVVEWLAISVLIPAVAGGAHRHMRRVAAVVVAAMVMWMAVQNIARWRERAPVVTDEHRAAERRFVERVRELDTPILSESALWPILAGREVILLDPFAARVVLQGRHEIESRLVGEIDTQRYRAIVLEFDPGSAEGEAMYGFAHLSPRVIATVRMRYRLDTRVLGLGLIFVPRLDNRTVDTPRLY